MAKKKRVHRKDLETANMVEEIKTGHRQRLRDRFLSGDAEAYSDEKLLELLLTYSIPRRDVMPLAKELIRIFGGLSSVLSAPLDELREIRGISESSITLLKAIEFVISGSTSDLANPAVSREKSRVAQQNLFEVGLDQLNSNQNAVVEKIDLAEESKEVLPLHQVSEVETSNPTNSKETDLSPGLHPSSKSARQTKASKKSGRRKMQVSNGHYLNFDHLARLISAISSLSKIPQIKMADLAEETGLPFRQVRNRVSIARALGLFAKGNKLQLTPLGDLISVHDPFCEAVFTLEYLHYQASSDYQNLIWYEVFNSLLINENAMNYDGWIDYFRQSLAGQYTEHSLADHLGKEIRFIIDAYISQNFQKLLVLHTDESENLYRRRYDQFSPLSFAAMIFDFCSKMETHFFEVAEMATTPGSPSVVFGLDANSLRGQIETLHNRGWLRYETTHDLDQIRLKPGFTAIEFLTAHFEGREPLEDTKQARGGISK